MMTRDDSYGGWGCGMVGSDQRWGRWEAVKLAGVLIAAFAVQLPAILYGFEPSDSGFYLTFYDNFFSNPEAVQYNFMYYFNGLMGWALLRLTGGSMIGIRIAGALCNVAVAWMAWTLLPAKRRLLPMLCAVLLIGAGSWGCVLSFNYDTATMLLATISILLLIKGASGKWRNPAMAIFFSGVVCGCNAFCRLPNFIDILFVFLTPVVAHRPLFSTQSRRMMLQWLTGWLTGVAAVLLLAFTAGHWNALWSSATSMFQAGASETGESIHSLNHLVHSNIQVWMPVLGWSLLLAGVIFAIQRYARRKTVALAFAGIVIILSVLASTIGIRFVADRSSMLLFSLAIGGAASSLVIRDSTGQWLRPVCLGGLLMVILLPAGSDGSLYGPGPLVLGVLLPAALYSIWYTLGSKTGLPLIIASSAVLLTAFTVRLKEGVIYFDSEPIEEMTATVPVKGAEGIRTTPFKAQYYGDMMEELNRHVEPGDTLMVYSSGPLINYLSGTLPALGCSWPAQFTSSQLKHWLETSPSPRYIMMLKFQPLGALDTTHPQEYLEGRIIDADGNEKPASVYHNPVKSRVMWDYIRETGYDRVAETESFRLYRKTERPGK